MQRIILDCDPGVDDCLALMLALGSPQELDIQGICTVAGNVAVETCTHNALGLLAMAGRADIPVYQGCPRPLVVEPETADYVHGKSGLGTADLPAPIRPVDGQHAVDFLIHSLHQAAVDPLTLVLTGPMTNLAVALVKSPNIIDGIKEIVIMGGARSAGGNVTASAEYNIYADPHAASVVLGCGRPITLIGLDATLQFRCTPDRLHTLARLDHRAARLAHQMVGHVNQVYGQIYGSEGAAMHDPCTIAYLLSPDLFTTAAADIRVSCDLGPTRGHTSVDLLGEKAASANTRWALGLEADQLFDLLIERMVRL